MTMKTLPLLSATVALALLTTTSALWAQPAAPAVPDTVAQQSVAEGMLAAFDPADTNKDGFLSKDEAEAIPGLSVNFDAVDTNKDGMVSKAELTKATKP